VIIKKSPAEIDQMAAAGEILVRTMDLLAGKIRPGVTTQDLDVAAEKFIRSQGATPAFKGYRGFPGSICASPNDMVVHGIPGRFKLSRGDILSVDIGVVKDGWVADAARTFPVGDVSPIALKLLEAGMVLAVEPMTTAGRHMVRMGDDGWAIYAQDGSLAAHFEFTIAVTADGPRILTPWHESKARVAAA
jgi:methionyl aminopeptidase